MNKTEDKKERERKTTQPSDFGRQSTQFHYVPRESEAAVAVIFQQN
jgi:hypothetical protein